jgi:hypothetical protein
MLAAELMRMSCFRPLSVALCFALALGACADKTGILLEVRSDDLSIPGDIDTLRFQAVSRTGREIDQTFQLSGTWPHSLTIVPAGEDDDALVITVTGLLGTEFRVRRVLAVSFERGSTRRVMVTLSRDCLGRQCPAGVDCMRGMCVDVELPDGGIDAGRRDDGGTEIDAGRDGGRRDGGERDGGSEMDAGETDAGSDEDAGSDGGTIPEEDAGTTPIVCGDDDACVGLLVISELAPHGPGMGGSGMSADEFVEIHNRSSSFVDASGVTVSYAATMASAPAERARLPAGTIIPPGGYYLVASMGYRGSVTPDIPGAWSTSEGFSSSRGAVLLRAGTTRLDLVGWHRSTEVPLSEGTVITGASDASYEGGASYERKARAGSTPASMSDGGADELLGNTHDTDDNSMDFVVRAARDPQNASSDAESP